MGSSPHPRAPGEGGPPQTRCGVCSQNQRGQRLPGASAGPLTVPWPSAPGSSHPEAQAVEATTSDPSSDPARLTRVVKGGWQGDSGPDSGVVAAVLLAPASVTPCPLVCRPPPPGGVESGEAEQTLDGEAQLCRAASGGAQRPTHHHSDQGRRVDAGASSAFVSSAEMQAARHDLKDKDSNFLGRPHTLRGPQGV